MQLRLDHVVFWVADPLRSLEFYQQVVGLAGVRVDEFKQAKVPFPSVRVSAESIIDLMPRQMAPFVNSMSGAEGSAGHPVNHVCLSMHQHDYLALRERVERHQTGAPVLMHDSFGARGVAPQAFYFSDPDGNVLEARYYA
jgi:catechol 2,3-dioxygenase-like lactoylglutathione lyase family enzyme